MRDSSPPQVVLCEITESPLDAAAHQESVMSPEYGAVAMFVGVVRRSDSGNDVSGLEYSHHPSAAATLEEIAREVAERPEVGRVAVSHRVGALSVGDVAVVAAVSAVHRKPALSGCEYLIEELKVRLPIWKHQTFADGTSEWVNSP